MISLRIAGPDKDIIVSCAKLLLEENLVIDVDINPNAERLNYINGEFVTTQHCIMRAKTKGLLFPKIDELINERFMDNIPEIYSCAIVHMDWAQANKLTKGIKAV